MGTSLDSPRRTSLKRSARSARNMSCSRVVSDEGVRLMDWNSPSPLAVMSNRSVCSQRGAPTICSSYIISSWYANEIRRRAVAAVIRNVSPPVPPPPMVRPPSRFVRIETTSNAGFDCCASSTSNAPPNVHVKQMTAAVFTSRCIFSDPNCLPRYRGG